jgi:hypothetical protein
MQDNRPQSITVSKVRRRGRRKRKPRIFDNIDQRLLPTLKTHPAGFASGGFLRWVLQPSRLATTHYGFTDEELDFIINYDIPYRLGAQSGEED